MKRLHALKLIVRHPQHLPVAPGQPRRRLALEALEDRCLLSNVITQFDIPAEFPPANAAAAITAGPDGDLWFTAGRSVGKITPAGGVTEYPTLLKLTGSHFGLDPAITDITSGPDGNLWFTEFAFASQHTGFPDPISFNQSMIAKITPSGTITEYQLPNDSSGPTGIAAGPDGKLWFTESNANKIGSITIGGTIQEFAIPGTAQAITTGPDGDLWFTEQGKVGRITPSGTSLTEFTLSGNTGFDFAASVNSITASPDGNVWVRENVIGGTQVGSVLARITPAGVVSEIKLSGQYNGVNSITSGPDGNLWFTGYRNIQTTDCIGIIRPDGSLVAALPIPYLSPFAGATDMGDITVGPRGSVWFTEPGALRVGVVYDYVDTLYEAALGRAAAPSEHNYWLNVAGQSGLAAVADGIQRSDEAHARLVGGWYQTYLGRPADAFGLQYFVTVLRTATEEQGLALMLASEEYFNHAPAAAGLGNAKPTHQTFVQALFAQLLGRVAGAEEAAYWQSQVAAQGREAAVLLLTASDEYRTDFIQGAYRSLLHRQTPASQAEVNYWLSVTLPPQNPGLPGGPEGGRISVQSGGKLDQESLKIAFGQSEEFALNG
jgi:virginiamycin B lyase